MPLGLVAGYADGWLSEAIMRVTDVFLALPQLVLALAQLMTPSPESAMIALALTSWHHVSPAWYLSSRGGCGPGCSASASCGKVRFDGRLVSGLTPKRARLARNDIQYVPVPNGKAALGGFNRHFLTTIGMVAKNGPNDCSNLNRTR